MAGHPGQRVGVTLGDRVAEMSTRRCVEIFSEFSPNSWSFKCLFHVSEPIKKKILNTCRKTQKMTIKSPWTLPPPTALTLFTVLVFFPKQEMGCC